MSKSIEFKTIKNLLNITSQENYIICNDDDNIYICDDRMNVLFLFETKCISNFIVFGQEIYFKSSSYEFSVVNITKRIIYKSDIPITSSNQLSSHKNSHIICNYDELTNEPTQDYRFGGSDVRRSHVIQLHYREVFPSDLKEIFEVNMPTIRDNTKEIHIEDSILAHKEINKLFERSYLDQFIENNDVYIRDDYKLNRIILSDLNDIIDPWTQSLVNRLIEKLYKIGRIPAGPFYYYAPLHALSWHTNMESSPEKWSYRMYTVSCTRDYDSFFCYKHPVSNMIHIIGDKDMHTNIFNIGDDCNPLWHAVINNSMSCKRLSLGFILYKDDDIISEKHKTILSRMRV